MIKITDAEFVGQFKVKSHKLRISDPCYDKKTWCAGVIDEVKNGTWESYVKVNDDNRVSELMAFHKDITKSTLKNDNWIEQDIDVGVDSGQCGIFDEDSYPEGKTGEYNDVNSFYGKCCKITSSDYGSIDFGVISSSGYGDGSYVSYILEEKDEVVGVKIIFIEDEMIDDEMHDAYFNEYDDFTDNYDD